MDTIASCSHTTVVSNVLPAHLAELCMSCDYAKFLQCFDKAFIKSDFMLGVRGMLLHQLFSNADKQSETEAAFLALLSTMQSQLHLLEIAMKEASWSPKPTRDQLRRPYKTTPFDREERPRITFDLNEPLNHRERQEQQSRERLFHQRWKQEQELKALQKRSSKKWQREHNKPHETWHDVYYKKQCRSKTPTLTV